MAPRSDKERSADLSQSRKLDEALDRSTRELSLLANFYHQHGYLERAQEIYRTLLRIRKERDKAAPDSGKSA